MNWDLEKPRRSAHLNPRTTGSTSIPLLRSSIESLPFLVDNFTMSLPHGRVVVVVAGTSYGESVPGHEERPRHYCLAYAEVGDIARLKVHRNLDELKETEGRWTLWNEVLGCKFEHSRGLFGVEERAVQCLG
jgi:hypothetical protein